MFLITVSNIMLYPRNPGEPAPRGARAVSLGRVVTVVTPPTSIYCTGGHRLKHALFQGPLAARTLADDARPSIPASRRDEGAPEDVLGFSRVAPELSHLSSKVATQSSTTRRGWTGPA